MTTARASLVTGLLLGVTMPAVAQVTAYGAAARVNGVEITNDQLEKNFEEYQRQNNVNVGAIRYPDRIVELRREVLEELIDQELVWQVVQEKQLYATPEAVDSAMERVREQFGSEDAFVTRLTVEGFTPASYREHVKQAVSAQLYLQKLGEPADVSADEIHSFYAENPDKFEVPEMVRARHILLKVHPNANDETRQRIRERMDEVIAELEAGADFAALAAKYSEDSSKDAGGDLGYFYRGQMVPQFEDAAFATEAGEVSGVVETMYGLHLIKVEDRKPPQTVPESMAQQQIYDYLLEVKRRQAIREGLAALRADADIEILVPL